MLFVNPNADAEPLEDYLDGIPERVADAGIDLDALRFLQRSESELDCNWKISAENFLECYHCPTAHPGFSAVMDVNPDAYLLEIGAARMTQHGPPRRGRAARTTRRARSSVASSTFSFPAP